MFVLLYLLFSCNIQLTESSCISEPLNPRISADLRLAQLLSTNENNRLEFITIPNKAFCANLKDGFSVEFDFDEVLMIDKLEIQGIKVNEKRLTLHGFTLQFSRDNITWYDYYGDEDQTKRFDVAWLLESGRSHVLEHELPKPAFGRYMKVNPIWPLESTKAKDACITMKIYGCQQLTQPKLTAPTMVNGRLKMPIRLECVAESIMNFSVSWQNSSLVSVRQTPSLSLYRKLSAVTTFTERFRALSQYSCVTADRSVECSKDFVCTAHQVEFNLKSVSKTIVKIKIELPDQLDEFKVVNKTKGSVYLSWRLPQLKDLPLEKLKLKLDCNLPGYPVTFAASEIQRELRDLAAYQSHVCTLQLISKNLLFEINQRPVKLEFRSRSEAPNILPTLRLLQLSPKKVRISVQAVFSKPAYGKLMGCVVNAVQSHYVREYRTSPHEAMHNVTETINKDDMQGFVIKGLVPWSVYNLNVKVFNEDKFFSNKSFLKFTTPEGKPRVPLLEVQASTSTTLSINILLDRKPQTGKIISNELLIHPGNITVKQRLNVKLGERQFFHVQKLKPNTLYEIQCRSRTSAGYGPFSKKYKVFTEEGKPNKPSDIEIVKKMNCEMLFLNWKPPRKPNGNVTKYEIELVLRNLTHVLKISYSSTDFNTNIPINDVIQVAIRAYTSKGPGAWNHAPTVYLGHNTPKETSGSNHNVILITSFSIAVFMLLLLGVFLLLLLKRRATPVFRKQVSLLLQPLQSQSEDFDTSPTYNEQTHRSLSESMAGSHVVHSNSIHQPIPVESFSQYMSDAKDMDYKFLVDEFTRELMTDKCYAWLVAEQVENRAKNRYMNVAAYDHSRVILKYDCKRKKSDYINASYIQGYSSIHSNKNNFKYISSQGPTENVANDFWHMVYQDNVSVIVMLTNLIENNKAKCFQYWPNEGDEKYGSIIVTLGKIDRTADYVIRVLYIRKCGMDETESRIVHHFHFVSWPDHCVPEYPTALLSLRRRVRHYYDDKSPMLVHCSAGIGRTGCYILIDSMLEYMSHVEMVDVFNYLKYLRHRRINMVQTVQQYIFAHHAILEYIMFGNTEILLHDLDKKTKELTRGSGMADQFAVLQRNTQSDANAGNISKVMLHEGIFMDAYFVDGYKQRNAFIMCLSPQQESVGGFWRMVLEQQCHTIVMLNRTHENSQDYFKYWPELDGHESYRDLTVLMNSEVANGNIVTRKIKVTTNKRRCEVHHFQYIDWPSGDVPQRKDYSNICTLMQSVEKSQQQLGNGPIVVHAGDDYGRSGTFVAIYNSTERLKVEQLIDVLQCVRTIRIFQPLAIDNTTQYQFVYHLLRIYLEGFENYWNYKDYKICKTPKNSTSTC